MTSLAPSYLLHILLGLFDSQDVPKIIFRYPYTQDAGQSSASTPSQESDDEVSENLILDSLLMYSLLSSDTCKLLFSVDHLLLLGHVEIFSQNKCSFVFILRADTPVRVLDRFYGISKLIAQV